MSDDDKTSKVTVFGISYFGIGAALGVVSAVITFIGAYIYCIMTYGFLLGLGLGWLPSIILAAMVGGAMVFVWGPVLALGLIFAVGMLFLLPGPFVIHLLMGASVGWVIWRISPKWLRGK